jgi:ferredoxin
MSYSAFVDPDICISSGNCVRRAPDAFTFNEDDVAEATPAATGLADDLLVQIAKGCPVGAVKLRNAEGAEVDPYTLAASGT